MIRYGGGRSKYAHTDGGAISILGTGKKGPTIERCTIEHNSAGMHGGAIFLSCSNALIKDCKIQYNVAGYFGAGIYIMSHSPQIEGNTISHNQVGDHRHGPGLIYFRVQGHGGGIYCAAIPPNNVGMLETSPIILNNIIEHNIAKNDGGAFLHGVYEDSKDRLGGVSTIRSFIGNTIRYNQAVEANPDFGLHWWPYVWNPKTREMINRDNIVKDNKKMGSDWLMAK